MKVGHKHEDVCFLDTLREYSNAEFRITQFRLTFAEIKGFVSLSSAANGEKAASAGFLTETVRVALTWTSCHGL